MNLLGVRGPKLYTVLEVCPQQGSVQRDDLFLDPPGSVISDTRQDAIGLLGHLSTLLAYVQPSIDQHSQVHFLYTVLQPLCPKPVALPEVVLAKVQDPTLGLTEPHPIGHSPAIQPVQIPLQGLPTARQINTSSQLVVICKLTEGALSALIQVINTFIKQDRLQYRTLRKTTHD